MDRKQEQTLLNGNDCSNILFYHCRKSLYGKYFHSYIASTHNAYTPKIFFQHLELISVIGLSVPCYGPELVLNSVIRKTFFSFFE